MISRLDRIIATKEKMPVRVASNFFWAPVQPPARESHQICVSRSGRRSSSSSGSGSSSSSSSSSGSSSRERFVFGNLNSGPTEGDAEPPHHFHFEQRDKGKFI